MKGRVPRPPVFLLADVEVMRGRRHSDMPRPQWLPNAEPCARPGKSGPRARFDQSPACPLAAMVWSIAAVCRSSRTTGAAWRQACRAFSSDPGIQASRPDEREAMEYDVCIVGAGPAGLSAAIRLKQVSKGKGESARVHLMTPPWCRSWREPDLRYSLKQTTSPP